MNEKTLSRRTVFEGRVLMLDVLEVETETGVRARREIVRHAGAVAVLAQRPDGRFVLVRQFRKAVERVMLEIVAGCLDEGETPADCAAREVCEETGHTVTRIEPLGTIYPTPGYCNEGIHLFYARLSETAAAQSPDEDERIEVVDLSKEEIERLVLDGEINDGKSLAAWLLFSLRARPKSVQS